MNDQSDELATEIIADYEPRFANFRTVVVPMGGKSVNIELLV
ncbi:hypothetical protein [Lentilactobacillus senioris]|nr:hypothetical protein [Lentilactobacillus senioris]